MSPTVTVATMPILTNTSAVRLAKKLLPHYWFRQKAYVIGRVNFDQI
jgi:hypothetical protein